MDAHDEHETMVERGILTERTETFEVADRFVERSADATERIAELDEPALVDVLADACGDEAEARSVVDLCGADADRLGRYLALTEVAPDRSVETRLRMLVVLEDFFRDLPPDDGSPASFLSVHPDQLPFLLRLSSRAIVYVWRHDCDPCDAMVESFDALFPEPPDDVTLLAVYGPADPHLLRERYGVVGGPTTLFVVNGEVDLRLHGAQYDDVLEDEVAKLRETD